MKNDPRSYDRNFCNCVKKPEKKFRTSTGHSAFKISQVTPIYKSGDVTDTSNYRPIATLSPFTKVLERLIYDQLYAFLEKFDVLYKYQFGFRKGFSTEQAILEITDSLNMSLML